MEHDRQGAVLNRTVSGNHLHSQSRLLLQSFIISQISFLLAIKSLLSLSVLLESAISRLCRAYAC